jgi:hypothetical protein
MKREYLSLERTAVDESYPDELPQWKGKQAQVNWVTMLSFTFDRFEETLKKPPPVFSFANIQDWRYVASQKAHIFRNIERIHWEHFATPWRAIQMMFWDKVKFFLPVVSPVDPNLFIILSIFDRFRLDPFVLHRKNRFRVDVNSDFPSIIGFSDWFDESQWKIFPEPFDKG